MRFGVWIVLAASVPAAVACGVGRMDAVGISTFHAVDATAATSGEAGLPSPVADDFRAHMTTVVARQLSRGHGLVADGTVWANDVARDAWPTMGPMPDGAVLVEEMTAHDARGDLPAGVLFMEKKEGVWHYAAGAPDGGVPVDARCQGCHAQAPRDEVFRVAPPPAGSAQPKTATSTAAITATAPTSVATTAATVDARSAGRLDASVRP